MVEARRRGVVIVSEPIDKSRIHLRATDKAIDGSRVGISNGVTPCRQMFASRGQLCQLAKLLELKGWFG